MAGAFRNLVQEWCEQVYTSGPHEIPVWFVKYESKREAYKQARKVIATFASMRQFERRKADKRMQGDGKRLLAQTPYEDIYCTIIERERCYGIKFMLLKDEKDRLFGEDEPNRVERVDVQSGEDSPIINSPHDPLANLDLDTDIIIGKR